MQSTSSNKNLIIGIVSVSILLFVGIVALLMMAPSSAPVAAGQPEQISFDDTNEPFTGPAEAKVVIRLFGDFQCPACKFAEPGVKYAIDKYKDRVKFVWKDFPLIQIHPNARLAANAARCAQNQGKFWEYHDVLYEKQNEWEKELRPADRFKAYAAQFGLDVSMFGACLDSRAEDRKVSAGMSQGNQHRVDRTPTVFVHNRRYFGMSPAEWDAAIGQALAENP